MGTLTKEVRGLHHSIESVDKWISTLTGRIQQLETNPPKPDNNKDKEDDDDGFQELDEDVVYGSDGLPDNIRTNENRLRRKRLHKNRKDMGGNKNRHNQGTEDPYAKIKFTIPSFHGKYDAEEYLDWEMTVEQKFASHLVPDHKVDNKLLVSLKILL